MHEISVSNHRTVDWSFSCFRKTDRFLFWQFARLRMSDRGKILVREWEGRNDVYPVIRRNWMRPHRQDNGNHRTFGRRYSGFCDGDRVLNLACWIFIFLISHEYSLTILMSCRLRYKKMEIDLGHFPSIPSFLMCIFIEFNSFSHPIWVDFFCCECAMRPVLFAFYPVE